MPLNELKKISFMFEQLFSKNPFPLAILSPEREFLDVNKALEEYVGIPRSSLVNRKCYKAVLGANEPCKACKLESAIKTKTIKSTIKHDITLSGKDLFLELIWVPLFDRKGNVSVILEIVRDITAQTKAEKALKESEKRYKTLVENLPALICRFKRDGTLTYANQYYCDYFGIGKESWIGKDFFGFIPEKDRKQVRKKYESLSKESPLVTYEHQVFDAQGNVRWHQWTDQAIFDDTGNLVEYQSIGLDITERKEMQIKLSESVQKLRLLSWILVNSQERERTRIARELHDQLGPDLASLKIKVRQLGQAAQPEEVELEREFNDILRYITKIIENVRRVSKELSPVLLEDLGLTEAIRYLLEDFTDKTKIDASVDLIEIDQFFSAHAKINIYRMFQEVLTNIQRHSNATRITVRVEEQKNLIQFVVKDNGVGFSIDEIRDRKFSERGIGLISIEERCRILGGTSIINTGPGLGTEVILKIPRLLIR